MSIEECFENMNAHRMKIERIWRMQEAIIKLVSSKILRILWFSTLLVMSDPLLAQEYDNIPCGPANMEEMISPDFQPAIVRCNSLKVQDILWELSQEIFDEVSYSDGESYPLYNEIISSEAFQKQIHPLYRDMFYFYGKSPSFEVQLMFADLFVALRDGDKETAASLSKSLLESGCSELLLIKYGLLAL